VDIAALFQRKDDEEMDFAEAKREGNVKQAMFPEITCERTCETSARIRERVIAARQRQQERFKHKPGITRNARMGSRGFKQYCPLDVSKVRSQFGNQAVVPAPIVGMGRGTFRTASHASPGRWRVR
jgi:predicted ATPase with chaperone activity